MTGIYGHEKVGALGSWTVRRTLIGIIFEISKEKIWKGKTALRISRLLSILEDSYGSIIDEKFKFALVRLKIPMF